MSYSDIQTSNYFILKLVIFHVFLSHFISVGFLFFYFQQSFLKADFIMFTNSRGYGGRWRVPSCFHFNQWYSKDNVLKSLWESLKHRSNLHRILFYRSGVILGNYFGRKQYCWFLHGIILWKILSTPHSPLLYQEQSFFKSKHASPCSLPLWKTVLYVFGVGKAESGVNIFVGLHWSQLDSMNELTEKKTEFYVCV